MNKREIMPTAKLSRHKHDINGIVFLALALFFAFAYYYGAARTGILGQLFLGLGKGLFGAAAYALPLIFLYMSLDYFIEKTDRNSARRIKHVLVLLLLSSTILQVFSFSYEEIKATTLTSAGDHSAWQLVPVLWKGSIDPASLVQLRGKACGGLLGGLLAVGLQRVLGQIGCAIFLFFSVLIELVLVVNLSFSRLINHAWNGLRGAGGSLNEQIRRGAELRATRREQAEAEAEAVNGEGFFSERRDQRRATAEEFPEIGAESEPNPLSFDPEGYALPDGHGGFLNVAQVEEGGAVHMSPEDLGLLGKYPEWDASSAFTPEMDETKFASIPIASYDAHQSRAELELISENRSSIVPTAEFHVPGFLLGERDRRNPAEHLEAELDEVLLEAEARRELTTQETADSLAGGQIRKPEGLDRSRFSDPHSASPITVPAVPSTSSSADAAALDADVKEYVPKRKERAYRLPPLSLLQPAQSVDTRRRSQEIQQLGLKLEETLKSFGVDAKVINITTGPAITRFELTPGLGVKVSKIVSLSDDIALSLAAVGVRIEAPIPGKSAIGIEIPNKETAAVSLRGLLESTDFQSAKSKLTVALGRDIPGAPILCDLTKMPHLLIAGATGSGKSVCINTILTSILYRAKPDEVKLLMIDPKVVELSVYNGIPHLLAPVVTDPKKAANCLNWAVLEMTRRYALFAEKSVRDINGYNASAEQEKLEKLPLILLVIDELSDLMMTAPNEVEDAIARLTAMARAAGIHLIIATQRPSVDVITGVIKANLPSRIAFAVSSQVDSRTIIDFGGAEKLLGKGDMLYCPQNLPKPKRGQCAFLSDHEVEKVVSFITAQEISGYDESSAESIVSTTVSATAGGKDNSQEDELFDQAVEVLLDAGYASVSILQRRMNVGYPRAARLIDAMELAGIIGPHEGAKPRKLLLNRAQWAARQAVDREN